MNLEWKLDLALRGLASHELLDTYTSERVEHVRHFIQESMELGSVICLTDPAMAAERDLLLTAEFRAGSAKPARPLPRLGDGCHLTDAAAGTLSIQAALARAGKEGLFDDVAGAGGFLLLADGTDEAILSDASRRRLLELGFRTLTFGTGENNYVDSTGAYREWFHELGADAVLVRPDYYIYGIATQDLHVETLVQKFISSLTPSMENSLS